MFLLCRGKVCAVLLLRLSLLLLWHYAGAVGAVYCILFRPWNAKPQTRLRSTQLNQHWSYTQGMYIFREGQRYQKLQSTKVRLALLTEIGSA